MLFLLGFILGNLCYKYLVPKIIEKYEEWK